MDSTASQTPPETKPPRRGCLLAAITLFLVVPAVLSWAVTLPLWLYWTYEVWHIKTHYLPVQARILESKVEEHLRSKGSRTYSVFVRYAYDVNDRAYEGRRYTIIECSTSNYAHWATVAQRYAAGTAATIYYDPADPAESVLNAELGAWDWAVLIVLPIIFLSPLVIGLWLVRLWRRWTRHGFPDWLRPILNAPALTNSLGTRR